MALIKTAHSLVTVLSPNFGATPLPFMQHGGGYQGMTATIVDSGRNLYAETIGQIVRDDVAKVTLSWNYLKAKQWSDILKLFTIALGGAFYNDVEFFDQVRMDFVVRNMYVSDRTNSGATKISAQTGLIEGYINPTFSLVER